MIKPPPSVIAALSVLAACAALGINYLVLPGLRSSMISGNGNKQQRDDVTQQGKMIGLALQMYAQNNDGYLPPPGADAGKLLAGSSAFDGEDASILGPWRNPETGEQGKPFTYTLASPTQIKIAVTDPHEEAGYKELTRGNGRVVVYTDGAAKWFPSQ